MVTSPEKQFEAVVAIIRDETERWKQERALRQRLAELEARMGEDENMF